MKKRARFNTWLPKVRPGGVILLHGIAVRTGDYSVWRLWEELLKKVSLLCVPGRAKVSAWCRKTERRGKENVYLDELFTSSAEHQELSAAIMRFGAERIGVESAETNQDLKRKIDADGRAATEQQKAHTMLTQQAAIAKGQRGGANR